MKPCPEWFAVDEDGTERDLPCDCTTCYGTVTGAAATRETVRALDALPEPVEPAPAPRVSLALELRLLAVLLTCIALAWALRQIADHLVR